MSNSEMDSYLNRLSMKIASKYEIPKERCDELVNRSPMVMLLNRDAEMVIHEPLSSWADLIYGLLLSAESRDGDDKPVSIGGALYT